MSGLHDESSWRIERLNSEHQLDDFDCGDREWEIDLNGFIKTDALPQQKDGTNTTLLFYRDKQLVAFASLLADQVAVESVADIGVQSPLGGYRYYPSVTIGKLAVDHRFKRQRVGQFVIEWSIGTILESPIGARFITLHVETENEDAQEFYKRMDFHPLLGRSDSSYLFLAYDLNTSGSGI